MTLPCGCCEGTQVLTPLPRANRPGLSRLSYRVGTHAVFLEAMKARLSSSDFPELAGLRTRDQSDPSIALLDAWATVADVLTFYQERIANEGYLQTATERRSILELARHVGYNLRPGVASSVYLAYTLEKGSSTLIAAGERAQSVPSGPGEKLQSFETFEPLKARYEWNTIIPRMTRPTQITPTNADIIGLIYLKGTSTKLKPNDPLLFVFRDRSGKKVLRRVKEVEPQDTKGRTKITLQVLLEDDTTFLKAIEQIANKYILLEDAFCISKDNGIVKSVEEILKDPNKQNLNSMLVSLQLIQANVSQSQLQKWISGIIGELQKILNQPRSPITRGIIEEMIEQGIPKDLSNLLTLIDPISKPPLLQPANGLRLSRSPEHIFDVRRDAVPQLLTELKPRIRQDIYSAWANILVEAPPKVEVYALRLTASLFGANAPPRMQVDELGNITQSEDDWPVIIITPNVSSQPLPPYSHEQPDVIDLDASYDKILPNSWVLVDTSAVDKTETNLITNPQISFAKAGSPNASITRSDYGISGKTTRIKLVLPEDPSKSVTWINVEVTPIPRTDFHVIRRTVVYSQSELLTLAEEPIEEDICGKNIELGALFDGLQSGRWVIVSGERADIPNTSGVKTSELVMLAGVQQSSDMIASAASSPDTSGVHSTLILDKGLAYTYKRDTVTIYANVVKATHGETKREVLGSGDGTSVFQQFQLRQSPLTYLLAATPAGAENTLQVRVNGILWHEANSLFDLDPKGRGYITKTDDASKTMVIFGNGEHGARIPTGMENVTAVYRAGIGQPGNVKAGQIKLLATKPPGVKAVINPLRASGGADREGPDQGRRNAPLATLALDRLVSTEDYAFFARTYAGIGKASAASLPDGHRQLVHLTIAGADDIPIDTTSDLFRNLNQALHQFGDLFQPVQVVVRELLLLVISAKIRLLPDYLWENVEPKIRSALLYAFSFDLRELGQNVFLSEAISVIQQVEGVDYVDILVFDSVSEDVSPEELAALPLRRQPFVEVNLAKPNDESTVPAKRNVVLKNTDLAKRILPAQLAYLSPNIKDTLILNPVELT